MMTINFVLLAQLSLLVCCVSSAAEDDGDVAPHVFVALQARNYAFLLPNFFGYFENLDYPKDRISIWSDLTDAMFV